MNEEQNYSSIDPELEARIVALVLGEASDAEREQLDQIVASNPQLIAFKHEIENVHELLNDVTTLSSVDAKESVDEQDDWKLSADRRSVLLASIGDEPAQLSKRQLAVGPADHKVLNRHQPQQHRLLQTVLKIAAVLCIAAFFGSLWTRVDRIQMARRMSHLSSEVDIVEQASREPVAADVAMAETDAPASSISGQPNSWNLWQRPSGSTSEAPSFRGASDALKNELNGYDNGVSVQFFENNEQPRSARPKVALREEDFKSDRRYAIREHEKRDVDEDRDGVVEFQIPAEKAQEQKDLMALSDQPQAMRGGTVLNFSLNQSLSRNAAASDSERDFEMGEMGMAAGQPVQADKSLGDQRFGDQMLGTDQQSRMWMEINPQRKPSNRVDTSRLAEASEPSSGPAQHFEYDIRDFIDNSNQPSTKQEAAKESLGKDDVVAINGRFDRYRLDSKAAKDVDGGLGLESAFAGFAPAGLDELTAQDQAFSTFSLHVSDVSFKLAQSALGGGAWPEPEKIRIEEFVNAFDYGDPMPSQSERIACRLEQAIHPFLQQRNVLRVSMRTAAAGRASDTPLRLTLLLDNSGSMERIDRQQTVRRAFTLLAQQLKPDDRVTLISFASQPRLLADQISGAQSSELIGLIENLPSEGGTNIEAALALAFEKALEQRIDQAQNRIILLTDGAVNLGDADPNRLSQSIQTMRQSGIAFDAAGISARGLNDQVLEALTRQGDGRYYLLDSLESADDGFARQIAGALRPSAQNVKVQVEFNPERVGSYKLLGFDKHRLDQEDFRNDQIDAAELAAAEAGVAIYQFQAKPDGRGDVGSISVRFRDLSTGQMIENRWPIPYEPNPPQLDRASQSLRISTVAALFAAKLRGEPLGQSVDLKTLANLVAQLPEQIRTASRVFQLQEMIEQARQINGN